MATNNPKLGRRQTLGFEPKNEDKVFVKIPVENKGFWEKEYSQNDLIGNVINDFKAENNVDIPKEYIMDWNYKNKSLKMNDPIRSLLVHEIPTICFNPEMKKKPLTIQESDIIPQVVGKPFNNPFEIFVFKKSDKVLKIKTYDENAVNKLGLNEYGSSSAYCNGNNNLFISGGETKDSEIINKLWVIDLNDNFLYDPYIIPPKKNHSMIFIPPGYVFVVGGNDKKTFYFDSETQEVYEWADLNKERNEPALERIGNTLYCFDNVNKSNDDQLSFEKTNLDSVNPEWDLFYPQIDPNLSIQKLPQKFFGVSKDSDNSIIFLGGNMDNFTDRNILTNYKYNPNNNNIEISNVPYRDYNFKEKTFLPYNKNIDYILPDFNKQHPEVVFYVKNKSKVEKVNYRPNIKSEHMLRGAKKGATDSKFDFNMPTISIPSYGPITENSNINKYAQIKPEKPKEININRYSINEPSFQEYDLNLNYKIEQPPPFKEPEIEPNKGDQRLSIEIPMDLIKKENEKMGINVDVDLKEEKKNDFEDNEKVNLRYAPRSPNVQRERQYFTQFSPNKNEYIIPRFHSSVNDPGNELIITSKGKIYTSYIPKEPKKVKVKRDELNIKSQRLDKEILVLPNFNRSVNMVIDRDITPSERNIKVNGDMNGNFKTPNIQMPFSQSVNINAPDYKLTGNISGLKGPKINMPSGNINVKGPDSNYEFSGVLPGNKSPKLNMKTPEFNLKGPTFKMSGDIPSANLNSPNIDLKAPDVKLRGPKINSPDFDLNGNIPGVNINSPNVDLKGPNIDLKEPNIDLKGPNLDLKGPNLDLKGPNVDLKGPNVDLKGSIPGIDINTPKIDLPSGDVKLRGTKISGPDYNLVGEIPGIKVNAPNIEMPKGKININNSTYNLTGLIPGKLKRSTSNFDIKGSRNMNIDMPKANLKPSRIHMHSPDINLKGSRRIPNYSINENTNLSGFIPGINMKGPKINSSNFNLTGNIGGNAPNIKIPSGKVIINGPNLEGPEYNLKGDIPGLKINVPKVDIKSPNVDINGPEYNLNGNIPGIKANGPKIDLNAPNINLKGQNNYDLNGIIPGSKSYRSDINIKGPNINGPNYNFSGSIPGVNVTGAKLKSPNINVKGPNLEGPEFNLKGDIPGMKVNAPNVEINAPNVDLKGPEYNLNGSIPGINAKGPKLKIPNRRLNFKTANYKLEGNIPGLKGNNSDYFLSGVIPSARNRSPNLEIRNYKITQPNIKYTTIEPNFDIKASHNNKLKSSINYSRGGSHGKRNFHASMNDPNYSEYNELKGSRRPLFSSQFDDVEIPYNKSPKKLNVSGVKIIDEKDVELRDPYNINNMLYLQGQHNDQNRKSVNLVVSKLEIQPTPVYNEIKMPENNIEINAPKINIENNNIEINAPKININEGDININNNVDLKPNDIDLKVENNNDNINLGDINIKLNNKNINLDNIGIKNDKIEIEDDKNINIKVPKIEIKNDFEIKPELPNIEVEQPKLESNIKINKKELTDLRFRPIMEEDNKFGIKVNINNENNFSNSGDNEENSSKVISGSIRKKGKGLPMVGIKNSNFQSSKIDVAGKLDVDNIDVNNMKSANVGVNGVKLGERIIE